MALTVVDDQAGVPLDIFSLEDRQRFDDLDAVTQVPTAFLNSNSQIAQNARIVLKVLYDYLVKKGGRQELEGLKQLYSNPEFDPEQIWFQLEDQLNYCERRIKKLIIRLEKKQQINLLDPELNDALDEFLEEQNLNQNNLQNDLSDEENLNKDDFEKQLNDQDDFLENGEIEEEGEEFQEGEEEQGEEEQGGEDEIDERKKRQKLDFEDDFMNVDEMNQFLEQAEQAYEKAEEGIEDDLEKALAEEISKMGQTKQTLDEEDLVDRDDIEMQNEDDNDDPEDNIYHEQFFGPQKVRNWNLEKFAGGVNQIKLGEKHVRFNVEDNQHHYENGYEVGRQSVQQNDADDGQQDESEEDESDDEVIDDGLDANATLQEQQQRQLQKQIKKLEKQALGEKDWFMKGEVLAHERPKDSVFQVDLDYDRTRKPPPEPTEERGLSLEDIIKNRIGEGKFDDVIRIVPMPPKKEKKELILDDTQNQKGLASLYEQDYVRTATGNLTKDKQGPLRDEIRQLYSQIAHQLDQLSHFSFAPMPVIEELSVKVNVPAIAMEEVGVNAVAADAVSMKLPEEVYQSKTKDGDIKADTELTKQDRQRRRRQQKSQFQAKKKKEMQEKGQLPENLGGWAMLAGRKSMLKLAPQKKEKTKYNSLQVFKQLETEKQKKQSAVTDKK